MVRPLFILDINIPGFVPALLPGARFTLAINPVLVAVEVVCATPCQEQQWAFIPMHGLSAPGW